MDGDVQVFMPLQVAYPETAAGAGFPHLPGAETVVKYNIKGTGEEGKPSERLWKFLSGLVASRGIEVLTSTKAKELISNDDGEILGLVAETERRLVSVKARKAVILTCGGFQNDPKMKWDYLPVKPVFFLGTPGNTGDGIRMVQKVGGDLWHMTRLCCVVGFRAPEFEAAFPITFLNEGFIFVDKYGRRFANEAGMEIHDYFTELSCFDVKKMEFPRVPAWGIFDEQTRKRGPLSRGTAGYNRDLYGWSLDNSKEIAKGWILRGRTAAELAAKTSIAPDALEETIRRYNGHCKAAKDGDFGRPKEDLRALEPPFYGIQLWPSLINTQGGPRRDKESRVLDPEGQPIPRLYAAGELGSIWGYLYQGACNISEGLVFGQIAGRNAAAENPWS
jgi:succinate dehydrogenase/fumarate reductase flavoprotein subunit